MENNGCPTLECRHWQIVIPERGGASKAKAQGPGSTEVRAVWSVGSPRGLQSSSAGPRGTDQHTSVRNAFNPGKEPWEKNMKSNSRTHPGSGLHFHHLQWEGPATHMISGGGALERILPQDCCKIIPKLTVFWSNRLTELKGQPPREQTLPSNVSTPREKLKRIYRDTEISNTQCLACMQNY